MVENLPLEKLPLQCLPKKLDFLSIYLIKRVFLAKGFELLMSCHPHDHLALNSVRFEASKKVLFVHVPQGAAKLQTVKLFSFSKITYFILYIILSYENSATYENF